MRVRLDPQARTLKAHDAIVLQPPRAVTLLLSDRFPIDALSADGRRLQPVVRRAGGVQRIMLPAAARVELDWQGRLEALDPRMQHRDTLAYSQPASGPQGAFLPAGSAWYPAVQDELEQYRVTLELPAGQHGLVPGRLLEERDSPEGYRARFEFAHPAEGIALIAGPYRIAERRLRTAAGSEVLLRTYFHEPIASLSQGYLDSVAQYLDLYERRIGAYPFSEFSVVSSPTPTGFGMPTLTYLGIDVLRLPFIRATSLGHEVLHNWWGNGVYPDYRRGNWSESLTTFMADYAYRERESEEAARTMRLTWLREYAAMPPDQDMPLARFTARDHGASQIVGYHKGAMLFFMLRERIGAEAFDAGIRRFWRDERFRVASWDDLRKAFEAASGQPLRGFFDEWLLRTGVPKLRIADARSVPAGRRWRIEVTLEQGTPAYRLSVPLLVRSAGNDTVHRVDLSRERQRFTLESDAEPSAVVLDPDQRVLRALSPDEAPPILREAMLAEHPQLVVLGDESIRRAGGQLAARLFENEPALRRPEDRPGGEAVLVAGVHAEVERWLQQQQLPPRPSNLSANRYTSQVWTLRANGGTILIVSVADPQALAALAAPLPHYGQQSFLVFEGARMVHSGVWPANPQAWPLR